MSDEFHPAESEAKVVNGWIALLIVLALLAFGAYFLGAGLGTRRRCGVRSILYSLGHPYSSAHALKH